MKHFSIFNTTAEYNAERPFLIRPQVALVKENGGVGFLGEYDENDTIYYKASNKLTETTSDKNAGLHTNAFNVSITSHTFANGIGVIKFAGDVTSIGNYAFLNCSSLTSITIPNGVTTIGQYAFQSCAFTSVIIPNSVTSIGSSAFGYCSGLTSVDIPNSVTSIGEATFKNCSGLTSITIPNSVTSIGDFVFYGCSKLTSVTIGNSVTSIGSGAFYGCSSLTLMICNATSAPTIQYITFQNIKTKGTLTVPTGSTGYDTWMQNANYYLGKYNWTKVEQ